jgi:hypothetical protein
MAFNQDLSNWNIGNVENIDYMFYDTSLSTYNYNQILAGRSQQPVHHQLDFNAFPTQYGGCESNAQAGINGHEWLTTLSVDM